MTQRETITKAPAAGDLLAIGFATATAMWAVGYFLRMPALVIPPGVLAAGLGVALLAGGFFAGYLTDRGWVGGLLAGLITGAVNLLIVGGVLSRDEAGGPSALTWIPGTLIFTAAVMAIMAAVGSAVRKSPPRGPANWTGRFARVAMAATFLLLIAGGLVTGHEAGLAVPDWPNSYGYNMILYPFARMTGNIYYEHAHRLYGVLVGLTTIVLAVHLWLVDRRGWLKGLAGLAIVAVIAQGIMGAARVLLAHSDGGVEVATAAHENTTSTVLRIAHGVFGQIFFALMVAIAVFCSTIWQRTTTQDQTPHPHAPAEKLLTLLLTGGLILQLIIGACVRHWGQGVFWHISLASILFLGSIVIGMRLWGLHGDQQPMLKRIGIALVVTVTLQIGLGIAALVVTAMSTRAGRPLPADVILTTMHQAVGAILLALATTAMLLTRRLLTTGAAPDAAKDADAADSPVPA